LTIELSPDALSFQFHFAFAYIFSRSGCSRTVLYMMNIDCTTTIVFMINQLYFSSISISPLIIIHPIALPRKQVRSICKDIIYSFNFTLLFFYISLHSLMMTGSLNFGSISFNSYSLQCLLSSLNKITC